MPSLTRVRSLFRNLLHRPVVEQQLNSEFHSCLEMLMAEKVAAGMSPEEASRAARIELGGEDQVKEGVRDIRAGAWLQTVFQDLSFGLRMIRHNPGFSSLVVFTLALGIGANTAIFSVVYGVLLRPLPYADGSRIVVLKQEATKVGPQNVGFSVKEIFDYRDYNHTLQNVVEYHSMQFLLLGKDSAERVQTGVVSANFFNVLGVKPILGRTFVASDDSKNADAVLVLSYKYWQERHGGDPEIVGKVFQMNNRPHTVIGVLPPIPQYPSENDVYMPTSQCPFRSSPKTIANRQARLMTAVFGRLKPGVSLQAAQADLSTVAHQLESSYPKDYPKAYGYDLLTAPLQQELTYRARTTLFILLGAAGFVLLIACANVANLMLARLLKRERELAVRTALGASKARLIRQLLTETVLLAVAGGVLGLALAPPALALLVKFAARFTTRAAEVKMDWHVLAFTLIVSVFAGLLFGVAPAFSTSRGLNDALKQGAGQASASHGSQQLRATLVVAQVAVSFMLLIGAGLMLRSLLTLERVDPGFRPDRILTMRISLSFSKYTNQQQYNTLIDNVLRRVNALGGVESAGMASNFPFRPSGIVGGPGSVNFEIERKAVSKGELAPQVDVTAVSSGYFESIRQPLVEGRTFTEHDGTSSEPVAMLNQTMARHRWPSENPIGRRVSFDNGQTWNKIVGIIGDVREYGLARPVGDEIYVPADQFAFCCDALVVRTAADPSSVTALVRNAVRAIDPQLAIDQIDTVERLQHESMASPRTITILLGIFATLALLISAAGIAGVMALSISQRTHELGIRMALGQSRNSVVQMLLQQGLALTILGTALGIAGSLALGRMLSSLLYQTHTNDTLTFAAVSLLFVTVAAFSCLLPAHRVTLIDPSSALRQE